MRRLRPFGWFRFANAVLAGPQPSITYSTLTSSAASFVAGGAGVTLTFTAKDANDEVVVGYVPQPESGVV